MTRYRHLVTDDNRKWWTLGAMCFALFMVMLDNTVVNVALPSIQREIHAGISELEWVINGYTLTFAVLIATGGRLGDIFGRRLMFLTGVIIFAITSAAAGLAQDPAMLIGSRAIQGIGAALMMPATLSIITHAFPAGRARQGDRHLGRRLGAGALDRPRRRRFSHRVRQLARDLLHQSSGRRRRGDRHDLRRQRVARRDG